MPQLAADRSRPRLARGHDVVAALEQPRREQLALRRLARAFATFERDEKTRRHAAPVERMPPADRADKVTPQRHVTVIHLTVRNDTDSERDDAGTEQGERRTVFSQQNVRLDVQGVDADRPRDERTGGHHQQQVDLHHRLQGGPRTAAFLVFDLEAEQRVAGHPCDARKRAHDRCPEHDEYEVVHDRRRGEGET